MISFATLFSSSKGNSIFVSSGKTKVLVDAGMAACHIENSLENIGESMREISAILITHEHTDHIKSAGSLSRRYDIPIFATPRLWQTYRGFGNIIERNQREYAYGMTIGDFSFDFFKTFHDAIQPMGLVIANAGTKLGICTDTGKVTQRMIDYLKNANGLVFESNHDPQLLRQSRYSSQLKARISGDEGHLSNEDAVEALKKIIGPATKEIVLAHLSEENNRPELAYETAAQRLCDFGINETIGLHVAPPYHTSEIIRID